MPIFEYKCSRCGHLMEVLVSSSDTTAPVCEKCKSPDTQKMLSGFAVGKSQPGKQESKCTGCSSAGACPYSPQ